MRFSPAKWIALTAYIALPIFCSCEMHPVGELPEVQREKMAGEAKAEADSKAPAAEKKATPAEFFPTKP